MSKESFEDYWKKYGEDKDSITTKFCCLHTWNHQQKRIDELEEIHRLQLAGIMTISYRNTRESLCEQSINQDSPYWTVAFDDVRKAALREIELIEQLKAKDELLREAVELIECKGCLTGKLKCSNCIFLNKPEIKALGHEKSE